MPSYFMKLDWDWREDPKIMDFEDRYGKAALVDVISTFCLMSEFFGYIDLNDNGQRLRVERVLRKKGKALDAFFERMAECGIIKQEMLHEWRRVCSDRSIRDGESRRKRQEIALNASDKAAEKRRKEDP